MSLLAIFVYGAFVSAIIGTALGLLAWGIVNEGRDRTRAGQTREVFGEATAAYASDDHGASAR